MDRITLSDGESRENARRAAMGGSAAKIGKPATKPIGAFWVLAA